MVSAGDGGSVAPIALRGAPPPTVLGRDPDPSGFGGTDIALGTSLRATSSAARTAAATSGSVEVSNQSARAASSSSGRLVGMSSRLGS